MYGIPGYDFQEREMVTGAKLRQWAEAATWRDLSASEVSGLVGIAYSETAPTQVTQGSVWYNPLARRFFVMGEKVEWVPLWAPLQYHMVRGRYRSTVPQRQPNPLQLHWRYSTLDAGWTAYNSILLSSAESYSLKALWRERGQGVITEDTVPLGSSAPTITALMDFGVAVTSQPFWRTGTLKDAPVKFDGTGRIDPTTSYVTDTTLPGGTFSGEWGIDGWLSPIEDADTSGVTMAALFLFPAPGIIVDTA